jgi:hypothetical protein
MEKLVKYRNWIQELLTNYATEPFEKLEEMDEQLIFDPIHDHYQIMSVGWKKNKRVFFCILHLDLKNGKIWLQENSTDYDIVEDLMALGVPASDIVLGFIPSDVRAMTDFAVA